MQANSFNFTKKQIEGLQPPTLTRMKCYWDTQTRGLCLLVTSTGLKTFYVRRKIKSKSERLLLGRFPELSIEQARAKAAEFHSSIAAHKNLAAARRAELGEPTLGELFDYYIQRHAQKQCKTWSAMQKDLDRSFTDWKQRKISDITNEEVEKRHNQIAKSKGTYAANRALELLRATYNKGIAWKICTVNPALEISPFPEKKRVRILRQDEFERFIAALQDSQNDPYSDFIMLCLLTGARRSNVLAMRWKDIDLIAATWTVPGIESKNGEAFTIALTEAELDILNRRVKQAKKEYVFPGTGRTGHLHEPKRAWKRILTKAGIEDLHIHDLRRSLASWMANTGANVSLIQSALNHKDVRTTLSVYAHTVKDAERSARQKAHKLIMQKNFPNNGTSNMTSTEF